MSDTVITIVGNLTADPELRFTASGASVANFTVASTPRYFDRQTNEWRDGDALFMRCSIWRDAAENVTESLHKGTRVIVTGKLKQRSFETREGERRHVVELDVEEIGPSLRYATAAVSRNARRDGTAGAGRQPQPQTTATAAAAPPPADDPWGSAPDAPPEEPPF